MIRLLKYLVIIQLSSLAVKGQIYTKPNSSYGIIWNRLRADSSLLYATYCGVPSGTAGLHSINQHMSALYYDSCGHRMYWFDPSDSSWTRSGANQLNDSMFIVGRDTITIRGTSGGGGIGTVTIVNTGFGLTGGPITSAGTAKADTAAMATLYNVNNSGKTYPFERKIGTIFEKSSWNGADMAAEFSNFGGTSVSLNGNYPQSISSTISWGSFQRFLPYKPTLLPTWSYTVIFKIVSSLGSNTAFGPAIHSNNIMGANYGYTGYIYTNSSSATPHISKQDGTSDSVGTAITISQNDYILMTLSFSDSVLTLTSQNLTTAASPSTVTYRFAPGTTPYVPNTGTFGFNNFSGTYEIHYIKISSNAIRNPTLAIAADSKGQINTSTFAGRFPTQLNANYPTVLQYSGCGDQLSDFIDKKEEVLSINPEQWWIILGSNDLRYGNTLATVEDRVNLINSWFKGTSTRVYWSVIPEDSTAGGIGLSNFNAYLAITYPSQYIDLWTPLSTSNKLKSIYNSGDGIHPNQLCNNKIDTVAIASGLLTASSPLRRSPYQKFGGGIKAIGDSLTMSYRLERGYNVIPRFDDSLNIVPSFIGNNNSYVQISPNLTQANHFGGALLDVDGQVSIGGGLAALYYQDRGISGHYSSQYENNDIFYFGHNGTDHSFIDNIGRWKIGADDGTTTKSTFYIRKSLSTSVNGVTGTGFGIDTCTYTLPGGAEPFFSHASIDQAIVTSSISGSLTDAVTLYVGGAPTATGSMTIVNPWSLYVVGKTRLGTTDSTGAAANILYYGTNGEIKKAAPGPTISAGTSAPATTPGKVGDIYVDTTNKKLYFAAGTSSSSDWIIAN